MFGTEKSALRRTIREISSRNDCGCSICSSTSMQIASSNSSSAQGNRSVPGAVLSIDAPLRSGLDRRRLLRVPRQERNCRATDNRGSDATSGPQVPAPAGQSRKRFPDEVICFAPGKAFHRSGVSGEELERGAQILFQLNIRRHRHPTTRPARS